MALHLRLRLSDHALADLDVILSDKKLNPEGRYAGRWVWRYAFLSAYEQIAQTRNQILERGTLRLSKTISITTKQLEDAKTPLILDTEGNLDVPVNDLMRDVIINTAAYIRCVNELGGTPVQWMDTNEWAFETTMGAISDKKRTLDLDALADAEKSLDTEDSTPS